jgi:3-methyl-2-oxobutanoate hydroxymethyltransferase
MRKQTLHSLQTMKNEQRKISMLTIYDATFAQAANEAGVDILLVGDSLGMAFKGENHTLTVSVEELVYHTRCVSNGNTHSVIISDLPFMTYYKMDIAAENSKLLLQAGAEIIKIEGGAWLEETVYFLEQRGIPVCPHIGLTPQYVHSLGGYKIQGRTEKQAKILLETAICLEQAGAHMLLVECIPYHLAAEISKTLKIPVIGIGAGPYCDGQVLVAYDILGLTPGKQKKFVQNFLDKECRSIQEAISNYVTAVQQSSFPTLDQSFE